MNKCIDCNKVISKRSIRCKHCNLIFQYKTTNRAQKISKKLTGRTYKKRFSHGNVIIICKVCKSKKEVPYFHRKHKFCGVCCSNVSRGRNSALKQKESRRSKNEISFYNLCKNKFKNVLNNEPIFNGWDADVILCDFKIAILWNGNWHHIKITTNHSVKQVQSRDKIKAKEIKKCGYIPYIIDDYGREDKVFVKSEFKKLLNFLKIWSLSSDEEQSPYKR